MRASPSPDLDTLKRLAREAEEILDARTLLVGETALIGLDLGELGVILQVLAAVSEDEAP